MYPLINEDFEEGLIFIDNVVAGQEVPTIINISAGRHQIELRKQGRKSFREIVDFKAGETRRMTVGQSRIGKLLVSANVKNAEVSVNGTSRGPQPVEVKDFDEGDHQVEVRCAEPGDSPWRQKVRIECDQTTKVFAQFRQPSTEGIQTKDYEKTPATHETQRAIVYIIMEESSERTRGTRYFINGNEMDDALSEIGH